MDQPSYTLYAWNEPKPGLVDASTHLLLPTIAS